MNNLIWICSYPKSGNTWVRSIIFAALMGEVSLNKFADVVPAFNASAIADTSNNATDPLEREVLCWDKAQHIASTKASPKSQMFKTHNAAAVVNGVEFPNKELTSKAVYIVRDPRDIALSYARHYDLDLNAAIEALLDEKNCTFDVGRAEFLSSWANHILSWQKKDFPVLILRYEDLLSAPYLQIPRLLAFLGVKTNLSIASLVELTSFTNLKRLEEKGGFDEAVRQQSFFWRGKSGFAKSFIGANYKDLESSFGEIMRSFRYL